MMDTHYCNAPMESGFTCSRWVRDAGQRCYQHREGPKPPSKQEIIDGLVAALELVQSRLTNWDDINPGARFLLLHAVDAAIAKARQS